MKIVFRYTGTKAADLRFTDYQHKYPPTDNLTYNICECELKKALWRHRTHGHGQWISHVNENPLIDLTPVFDDYRKHLAGIKKNYEKRKESDVTKGKVTNWIFITNIINFIFFIGSSSLPERKQSDVATGKITLIGCIIFIYLFTYFLGSSSLALNPGVSPFSQPVSTTPFKLPTEPTTQATSIIKLINLINQLI